MTFVRHRLRFSKVNFFVLDLSSVQIVCSSFGISIATKNGRSLCFYTDFPYCF